MQTQEKKQLLTQAAKKSKRIWCARREKHRKRGQYHHSYAQQSVNWIENGEMERLRKRKTEIKWQIGGMIEGKEAWGTCNSSPTWRDYVGEDWSQYTVHRRTDISLHIYRTCVEIVFLTLCQLSNSAPEGRRLFSASVLELLIDTNAERVALCHT